MCSQVTCGGLQSAHTAAIAALCAERGVRAHLLVRGERPAVPTGLHLYARMLGRVTYVGRGEYADRKAMFAAHVQRVEAAAPDGSKVRQKQDNCIAAPHSCFALESRGLPIHQLWWVPGQGFAMGRV
jgi:1-aminocyclopropane-1-carboxylate deaminase/D-cysteine desulfhydrase-like pyridoxal-dependent ACC family enzyme